jgi:predicted aspartyl protease
MPTNSRRRFLTLAGAALALPQLARASTVPPSQTHAPPPPPAPDESIEGALDYQNRLTLDASIDGHGPYKFVVDTGSDRSVISAELAASLGLLNSEDVIVQGISRSLSAQTVTLRNVTFGSITIQTLHVPVLPRHWLGADGYLGIDAVDGRRVTFDFQNNRIVVAPSSAAIRWSVTRSDEVIVRVSGSSGRLKATDCSVDRVPVVAFVDSGAEYSIGNTALFNELAKGGATYIKDVAVPVLGATGGQTLGRLTYVSDIRVGTMNYSRSDLIIADLEVFDVWGLSQHPAIFLGMNFLQNMAAFTIDYARKELRFKMGALERLATFA